MNLKFEEIRGSRGLKILGRVNPKRSTLRHVIIKLSKTKVKERILKGAREKQLVMYKGSSIKLSADFSAKTLEVRKQCNDVYKVLKEKKNIWRILFWQNYSSKMRKKSRLSR